jgi:hypothetical protein
MGSGDEAVPLFAAAATLPLLLLPRVFFSSILSSVAHTVEKLSIAVWH